MSFGGLPPDNPAARSRLAEAAMHLTPEAERAAASDRPATFPARARWHPAAGERGHGHGHGQLLLSEGAATFAPTPGVQRHAGMEEIEHGGGEITLVRVRLRPPWDSAIVLLRDRRHGEVAVHVSTWSHRGLRRALRGAGFPLAERAVWRAGSLAGEAR